eukprot:TRINITY_DN95884_c0_g1_i1.p1 TRINITY_DN95884_c0_g1~~TRINITY_DN95884_c0_g1_i1.p1  ORF type:complete len:126 (-),score=9.41 TRINITY_DN95884_c0_g1_i1:28-405(-)
MGCRKKQRLPMSSAGKALRAMMQLEAKDLSCARTALTREEGNAKQSSTAISETSKEPTGVSRAVLAMGGKDSEAGDESESCRVSSLGCTAVSTCAGDEQRKKEARAYGHRFTPALQLWCLRIVAS